MSKTKKVSLTLLALVCVFALAMSTTILSKASAGAEPIQSLTDYDFYLSANDLDAQAFTDSKEFCEGKITIQGSVLKSPVIESNSKFAKELKDGEASYAFTKRLKTDGYSEHSNLDSTVLIDIEKPAQIDVYAFSGSSKDGNRTVSLYKNGGSKIATSAGLETSGTLMSCSTFEVTEPGSYYLAADANTIGIYFVGVKYTAEVTNPVVRKAWNEVVAPVVGTPSSASGMITVPVTGLIGVDGADNIVVKMYNTSDQEVGSATAVKYGSSCIVAFKPTASNTVYFKAEAHRKNETNAIVSEKSANLDFILPFTKPSVRARTSKAGQNSNMVISATVTATAEADVYKIFYKLQTAATFTEVTVNASEFVDGSYIYDLPAAAVNSKYDIKVSATRNKDTDQGGIIPTTETLESSLISATVRPDVERDWAFAAFGQSTKSGELNTMSANGNIYDGFSLYTCSIEESTGRTVSKGGKFTYGAHDGISYYYTKVDAENEDFRVRATVTVDYINPTPDGQEGFAILVRDSIGIDDDTSLFYTNSAAAIATKIQYKKGAANVNVSDGLGARFVTGIESTVDIPTTVKQTMYTLNGDNTIAKSQSYDIEVEKVNNCYFVRYYFMAKNAETNKWEEQSVQKCLYYGTDGDGNNYDQLRVIDKDNVYVGFACARGLNATFSKIEYEAKPRSNEVVEIIKEKVIGDYSITSPTTSSVEDYKMNFFANADGVLSVKLNGETIVTNEPITNYTDFFKDTKLKEGLNTFDWTFKPNDGYEPSASEVMETYKEQTGTWTVNRKCFGDASTPIYCAPHDQVTYGDAYQVKELAGKQILGKSDATGTLTDPVDLQTAINYVLPGQKILMFPGEYFYQANITVEKGNNGYFDTATNTPVYKYLMPASFCDTRPVINFRNKGTGIKMWGNYWHMYGFDVINSAFSSKAIQVSGNNSIIENVVAHHNGDTGISVSGRSTDPHDKWPDNNIIKNCTAYMNKDKAEEDADGFAAKLYCGEGNKFIGCISYCNADDGWDLYAKTETGKIGAVTIEDSIAFGNGFNLDGSATDGNGNGFKLGGESLAGGHSLKNSISFGNKMKGIDSNSCPDDIVQNCTSVYNAKNYAFYSTVATNFMVFYNLSLLGGDGDDLASQKNYPLENQTNYFFKGENLVGTTENSQGSKLDMSIFKGWTENSTAKDYFLFDFNPASKSIAEVGEDKGFYPIIAKVAVRNADDSINMNGLLELKDSSMTSGAKLTPLAKSEDIVAPAVERTNDYDAEKPFNPTVDPNAPVVDSDTSNSSSSEASEDEKSGCFSSIGGASYMIGFAVLAVLALLLAKKQSKKNK